MTGLHTLFAAVTATALSAEPSAVVQLAAPGLTGFRVEASAIEFYSNHLAQRLSARGLRVTTAAEIQLLLGLERQKQLMGCADESPSCMVELANALGADGVVTGHLGRFGEAFQLDVKIVGAAGGAPLGVHSQRINGEEALLAELDRAAHSLAEQSFRALGRAPPRALWPAPVEVSSLSARRTQGLATLTAATLLGGTSVTLLLLAKAHDDALRGVGAQDGVSILSYREATATRDFGRGYQVAGLVAGALSLAGFSFGAYWTLSASAAPGSSAAVTVSGSLP